MTSSIGSDFHLPFGLMFAGKKKNLPADRTFLDSGRACLKEIIAAESPKTVLLPAYLCDSVLLPFKEKNVLMTFYHVNQQLVTDEKNLFEKIKKDKPDMVMLIHYFGWIQPATKKIIQHIRKQHPKGVIIEDLVQSYLTAYKPCGDYWFNSYRKFLPVADGAFIGGKKRIPEPKKTASSGVRLMAMLTKNIPGMRLAARRLFQWYERHGVNSGVRSMSRFSRLVIERIDEEAVKKIRRQNYQYLMAQLKENGIQLLFSQLPNKVCPLGLPIIVKNRNVVQYELIRKKIYCPVHWHLPSDISKKKFPMSHAVSEQILTIPIDQRYTEKDMERIAKCLKKIV